MRLALFGLVVLLAGCGDEEPGFTLVPPDETVTLVLGQLGEVEVGIERTGGLDRTVVVTAGGLRAGITPGALTLGPGDAGGTLTLAVETSATVGPIDAPYLIGVAGDLEVTAPLSLVVAGP